MMIGVEAINAYVGKACVNVREIFEARNLDTQRFDNLMMHEKSLGAPWEDAVTFGVNSARPILDRLDDEARGRIELSLLRPSPALISVNRSARTFTTILACRAIVAFLRLSRPATARRPHFKWRYLT